MSAAPSSTRERPVLRALGSVYLWLVEGILLGVVVNFVAVAALNIPVSDPLDGPPEVTLGTPILGGVLGLVGAALMAGALVPSVARWSGTPLIVATLGAGAAWLNTAVYVGGLIEPIEQMGFTLAPLITGFVALALIYWRARVRLRATA